MNNKMKLFGFVMFSILLLGVVVPYVLAQEIIPEEPIPVTTTTMKTTTTTTTTLKPTTTTITTTTTTIKPTTTTMLFPDDPIEAMSVVNTKVIDVYSKVRSADLKLDFFGTEYQAGASGTIWLQLLRNYQPINDASCYVTAYYPDKSVYLNRTLMSYLADSDGLYYYDFTVPSVQGVYMLSALCLTPADAFGDTFTDTSYLDAYVNVTVSGGKVYLGTYQEIHEGNVTLHPIGLWHLNENSGTTAYDSSGYGKNGLLSAGGWISGCILHNCWTNNGVDTGITVSSFGNFERNESFSAEAWIKTSSANSQTILGKMEDTGNGRGWSFAVASNKAKVQLRNITGGSISAFSSVNVNDNNWHHVVMTYDGSSLPSGIVVYVDGVDTTINRTGSLTGSIKNSAIYSIGSRNLMQIFFYGRIDESAVYDYVLNQSAVDFRYNSSFGSELSNNSYSVTRDATSGYIRSVDVDLTGDSWYNYFSDYISGDGSVVFRILDSTNSVICTGLGDISSCAGVTTPIKLYAELTRPENLTSPELYSWYVTMFSSSSEEIRGSSELHVSALSVNNSAIGDEVIIKMLMNARILNERVVNFHNHQYCIDNMTLQHNITYEYCAGSGNCRQMVDIMDENCAYGCDYANSSCKPSPLISIIIFIIFIAIFAVAVIVIGKYV